MKVKELIKALRLYDQKMIVKINDLHKGLDDVGVVKEVADGHIEILPMSYGKDYFENEDFAKWLTSEGWFFSELTELWYREYEQTLGIKGKTFDEILKEFKERQL